MSLSILSASYGEFVSEKSYLTVVHVTVTKSDLQQLQGSDLPVAIIVHFG